MAKYANSEGTKRPEILKSEIARFKKLVKGHEKLLEATGKL
ncbi:MAG: hypothetical protein V1822_02215 [Candidatus Micrarchaeota archaeon]